MDDRELFNRVCSVIETELYRVEIPAKDARTTRMAQKIFRLVRDAKPAAEVLQGKTVAAPQPLEPA